MPRGFLESLPVLVARKFAAAKESGALIFSPTHVTTIEAFNIPVGVVVFS